MAYSHSQIQTYLTCQLKYFYEKIEGIKPTLPEENLHLTLGNTVHSALENLYKKVSDFQIPSKKELLNAYFDIWNKKIREINLENGKQVFDIQTLKEIRDRGEHYINYYYDTYKPFDQAIAMQTEMNLSFELDDNISFSGKIDRLDIDNETVIINDYKTNKSLPKDGNDTIQDQITMYALGIQKYYGTKVSKIVGNVIYLHLQREIRWEIFQNDIDQVKEKYMQTLREIELKKQQYADGKKDLFLPKAGFHCDSCVFKILCPLYKHSFMENEQIKLSDMKVSTVKSMIDEYARLSQQIKQLENDKKYYSEMLVNYAQEKGCAKLYGQDYKLSISQRKDYSINKEKIQEFKSKLIDMGILEQLLEIDKSKLNQKIKKGEIDFKDLNDFIFENIANYISRSSEIKKDENDDE